MIIFDRQGYQLYEAPITSEAIVKYELMGDYYVQLSFETAEQVDFKTGSYILYGGRKFEIISQKVRPEYNATTGGYKYTPKFEARQNHMKRRKVFWLKGANDEATFSDTTDLASFGNLIADNMNAFLGTTDWKVAAVPDDLAKQVKLVSFDADYCWDAINTIAETFDVEWWTVENGDEIWIYFGKLEFGTPERFERGNVVSSIPEQKGDNSNYGTRFYVFGSTRNLTSNYASSEQGGVTNHISETRLHLPNGQQYIDAWTPLDPNDIVEQVAFFEDIYPKNTETVTSIETVERSMDDGTKFDAYVMVCADTPFTPDDLIAGETIGAHFTSGSLNGWDFELSINESDFDKKFEIIAQTQDSGEERPIIIPNEILHPEPGDTFVLTGVNLPKERIREAEQELLEAGKSWAAKNSSDTDVYPCPTNPVYCQENDKNYDVGQKVLLVGPRFGEQGRLSRIQGYEKKLYNEYIATYTVGDNTAYSRFGKIEKSIDAAAYAERIGVVSGVGIYLIRSKYDLTYPTDYNTYSALAIETLFLNKRKGGVVQGDTLFSEDVAVGGDIVSRDFRQGDFSGAGYAMYKDAAGNSVVEADRLIVRKDAVFNELVIRQTDFVTGETVFSCGGFECTSVEETATAYRCYYNNHDGAKYSGLKVGDQVRCQRYAAEGNTVIKYYWRLVTAVTESYVDLSKTDADGNGIPDVGDNIVQFGNRTDVARQSAVVIDATDGGSIVILAHIDSYTLSEKNYVGQGVNPFTGEAYMYVYGDMFFGDRDLSDPDSTYITYQRREGATRRRMEIKADIVIGKNSSGLHNLSEWTTAQQQIDKAQQAASDANDAIAAMNDDTVFDIVEKQQMRIQWETINGAASVVEMGGSGSYYHALQIAAAAEGLSVFATADGKIFLVRTAPQSEQYAQIMLRSGEASASSLTTSYLALRDYLAAMRLYDDEVTEGFDPRRLAELFTAYYDALDAVYKGLSDKAQQTADEAAKEAAAAKKRLDEWASDDVISPTEKTAMRQQEADIRAEHDTIVAQANLYGVSTNNYNQQYDLAIDAFAKYTASTPENIPVEEDYDDIRYYYTERNAILKRIDAAQKAAGDKASHRYTNPESDPPTDMKAGDTWSPVGADGNPLGYTKTYYGEKGWVITGDDTKTVIENGLVTTGTVLLGDESDPSKAKAGVTGAGTTDGSVRFWAGSEEDSMDTAPFRVTQAGKVYASDAEIAGKVDAKSGSIGGVQISENQIGIEGRVEGSGDDKRYIGGVVVTSEFIKFSNNGISASFGANVAPAVLGVPIPGIIRNEASLDDKAYGLQLDVQGAVVDNIALDIPHGAIHGVRHNVRILSNAYWAYELTDADYEAIVNDADITVRLPAAPQKGQVFRIWKHALGNATIQSLGPTIRPLGSNSSGTTYSIPYDNHNIFEVVYTGSEYLLKQYS
nr:MAG TPA: tail protein [Caudoviricetes sp.]